MGDPRRQRRKYTRPTHLWRMDRIEEENELINKYGLKNKKEIWRAKAATARVRRQAIKLQALLGVEADKEKNELIGRLNKLGLVKSNALEAVLALGVEDLLERRLQTIVYRKGIAQTPAQARQLVIHGHILVGEKVVNVPRYPVKVSEENLVRLKEGVKTPEVHKKEISDKPDVKEKESIEGVSIGQKA